MASYLCLVTEIVTGCPLDRIAEESTLAAAASELGDSSASPDSGDSRRASLWSALWRSSTLSLYPVLDRCNKFGRLTLLVTCTDGVVEGGGSLDDDGGDVLSKSIFCSSVLISQSVELYYLKKIPKPLRHKCVLE